MALNASSTTADVLAAYANNASYEEHDSLSEAQAFVSACRLLLSPAHSFKRSVAGGRGGSGGSELELSQELLVGQLQAAQVFVSNKLAADSGGVLHCDFSNFRS